jgi:NAD(P)-dependent dehydrogenase (short-subunit alcohol dehydrogenase family)
MTLQNKVILITGAAKRIGRAIALELHAKGAKVLIHYYNSEKEALETAAVCGNAPLLRANLTVLSEVEAMFEQIEKEFGALFGLVNNAAIFQKRELMELSEADWDQTLDLNLKAVFFCSKYGAALIKKSNNEGRIVNICSLGAFEAWPNHAHYNASKAGVLHLTRSLAVALAPQISVNAVAPGVVPFSPEEELRLKPLIEKTPAKRAGTGEEIARAVAYFMEESTYLTGQTLLFDGGLSL